MKNLFLPSRVQTACLLSIVFFTVSFFALQPEYAGQWASSNTQKCSNLTIEKVTPEQFKVTYGWCSDEKEKGTLTLANGTLAGIVIDNMTKAQSKCQIAFLSDKKTLVVKTICPSQPAIIDSFIKK